MEELLEKFDKQLDELNSKIDELEQEANALKEEIDHLTYVNDYPEEERDRERAVLGI